MREALVVGGGMAGLLAARILSDRFDRVTILERDRLPGEPEFRAGVPQGRHVHVLLSRGRDILERLFPGLEKELLAAGAEPLNWSSKDFAWLTPRGWATRFRSELTTVAAGRPLVEWSVRRRVAACERVRFIEEREVTGLLPDGRGVRVRPRGTEAPGAEQEMPADLVVDAGGRDSGAPRWLEALGFPRPEESVVEAFIGYTTRCFRRPAAFSEEWKALFVQLAPPLATRGGSIFPLGGGLWIVSLVGIARDYAPTDEAGYIEFARSLRTPRLFEAIEGAEPVSPIVGYRACQNRARHYERMKKWPERFIALGDSACALNPVYGQGMTVAGIAAESLERALGAGDRLDAHAFQKKLARANAIPWLIATSDDFRSPATTGGPPSRATRVLHAYLDRVIARATRDARAARALTEVLLMLRSPAALLRPGVVLGVAKEALLG